MNLSWFSRLTYFIALHFLLSPINVIFWGSGVDDHIQRLVHANFVHCITELHHAFPILILKISSVCSFS